MLNSLSLWVKIMSRLFGAVLILLLLVLWVIVAIEISNGIGNSIRRINREDDEK